MDDEGQGGLSVNERGRGGLRSPCAIYIHLCFFRSVPQAARKICFWDGREAEPTGIPWQRNHVRAKERVDQAEATRRPLRTPAGRQTGTHDRRAHRHESSNHRLFFWIFVDEAVHQYCCSTVIYVTALCSVARVVHALS